MKIYLWLFGGKPCERGILFRALVLLITVSLLTPLGRGGPLLSARAERGGSVPQNVITNYPYSPGMPPVIPDDIPWIEDNHGGYDGAYTKEISIAENGRDTDSHVVTNKNKVTFYGYQKGKKVDYIFTQGIYNETYGNSFVLYPERMDFHSFSETGYFFNGEMSNGRYTGYAVILQCANTEGMQENKEDAANTAALRLYYLTGEQFETDDFTPDNDFRELIATYKTEIKSNDTTPIRVNAEIDPASRAFKVYVDGVLCTTVDANTVDGDSNDTGFGFYCGYYDHQCDILTKIKFEDVTVDVTVSADPVTAELRFLQQNGTKIISPVISMGYAGQRYAVKQPQTVTDANGDKWYLTGNDVTGGSISKDIVKTYRANAGENITALYYFKPQPNVPPPAPLKGARVKDGIWDNGTEDRPVGVKTGSEIEYKINAYGQPPRGTAMMVIGNQSYNADDVNWFNQPSGLGIKKGQIKTAAFVNLGENFTDAQSFMNAYNGEWNGKPIVNVWDATENKNQGDKVFAWVTVNGGFYDLFIGGYGGVWIEQCYYTFCYFSELEEIDLTYLYTNKATTMLGMFDNCKKLTHLDLSSFDTSKVESMQVMFRNCQSLKSVDLSSFETSNVTTMTQMFTGCSQLASVDFGSFTSENLINISSIFYGSVVTEAYWDGSDFQGITTAGNAANSATLTIYVKDQDSLDKLRSLVGTRCKIVVSTRPPFNRTPAPDPNEFVTVQDVLPIGLEFIDDGTAAGTKGNYITDQITYKVSGQTLTWKIPKSLLPAEISFRATVTGGTDGQDFINSAYADNQATNKTYHRLTSDYRVTERYAVYGDDNTEIDEAHTEYVENGNSYSIFNQSDKLSGYSYRGYSIDGGGITESASPPNTALAVNADMLVTLYYSKYSANTASVFIHYLDAGGNKLKTSAEEAAVSGADYYIPKRHFDGFSNGSEWVYYGYSDNSSQPAPSVGASAVYPPFSVPMLTNITGSDNHVYLYFTNSQAVTVRFVECGNEAVSLKDEETYFAALPSDLQDDIQLDGKTYVYKEQNTDAQTVTLKFSTRYKVTEKFMTRRTETDGGDSEVIVLEELKDKEKTTLISGGDPFETAPLPIKEISGHEYKGYTFDSPDNVIKTNGSIRIAQVYGDNIIIYIYDALLERTVTYDANGGDELLPAYNTVSGVDGDTVDIIFTPPPTRAGYQFRGWATTSAAAEPIYTENGTKTFDIDGSSVTLYAVWSLKEYKVVYDLNGGTSAAIPDKTVTWADAGLLPGTDPAKDGYTFAGWHYNGVKVNAADAYGSLAVTDTIPEITLQAQWTVKTYSITYHNNGGTGSMPQGQATHGASYDIAANTFSRDGYTFTGWNIKANGSGMPYAAEATIPSVTADIDLYAQWTGDNTSDSDKSYTVEYDLNGGTSAPIPNKTVKWTDSALLPNAEPTRDGYVFTGWHYSGRQVNSADTYGSLAVTDKMTEITLQAQWMVKTYSITYHNNGGTGSMPQGQATHGASYDIAANAFSRDGYTFTGWNTKANGSGTPYAAEANIPSVTADIDLYARWTGNNTSDSDKSYTVEYDLNGGTSAPIPNKTVKWTDSALLPGTDPTRDGYVFKSWTYKDQPVDSGDTYAGLAVSEAVKTVSLKARWDALTYEVTYHANGGLGLEKSFSVEHGTDHSVEGNRFNCDGYIFNSWNTEEDGTGDTYMPGDPIRNVKHDINLYAQWTPYNDAGIGDVTYTVNYYANGALGSMPADTIPHGKDYSVRDNEFTYDGYIFSEWNAVTSGSAMTVVYGDVIRNVTDNIELYAQWRPDNEMGGAGGKEYAVTYHSNGGSGSMIPDIVIQGGSYTVRGNDFYRTGYNFSGWNTRHDGGGTDYAAGDNITDIQNGIDLYARWTPNSQNDNGQKESEIIRGPNLPEVGSGNLLDVLGDESDVFDAEDQTVIDGGGTVKVELYVNEVNTPVKTKLDNAAKASGRNYEPVEYVDLSVAKTWYNSKGAFNSQIWLSDLKNVYLDIEIPVTEKIAAVYRIHGSKAAEALPEGKRNSGEYFFFTQGGQNAIVTLHVNQFSGYLLVKLNAADNNNNNGGSNGSSSGSHSGGSGGRNGGKSGSSHSDGGQSRTDSENPAETILLNTAEHLLYINGIGNNLFAPNKGMTRAEAAQMFYNLLLDRNLEITKKFPDIFKDIWYTEAVETMASLDIISGYPDGNYYPDKNITRAEFSAIAVKFSNAAQAGVHFDDVPEKHWAYDYISTMASRGWISGMGNGRFEPDREITRAEAVTIVNTMLKRHPDKVFIDEQQRYLIRFNDITAHWAYYGIMEASNTHEYESHDGTEKWVSLSQDAKRH